MDWYAQVPSAHSSWVGLYRDYLRCWERCNSSCAPSTYFQFIYGCGEGGCRGICCRRSPGFPLGGGRGDDSCSAGLCADTQRGGGGIGCDYLSSGGYDALGSLGVDELGTTAQRCDGAGSRHGNGGSSVMSGVVDPGVGTAPLGDDREGCDVLCSEVRVAALAPCGDGLQRDSRTYAEVVGGKRKRSRSRGVRAGVKVKAARAARAVSECSFSGGVVGCSAVNVASVESLVFPSAYGVIVESCFEDICSGDLEAAKVKVGLMTAMSEMEDFVPDLAGSEVVRMVESISASGFDLANLAIVFDGVPSGVVGEVEGSQGSCDCEYDFADTSLFEVD